MKFISWNVNGLRACVGKEDSSISVFLVMNLIGITLIRRAILVRLYIQNISH